MLDAVPQLVAVGRDLGTLAWCGCPDRAWWREVVAAPGRMLVTVSVNPGCVEVTWEELGAHDRLDPAVVEIGKGGHTMPSEDARVLLGAWQGRGGVGLCGSCSRTGACQLGIRSEALGDDNTARFDIVCPESFGSGPGVAHGGWTAAMFADAMPHVPFLQGHLVVTGTLAVRFIRPVPIRHPLLARAWVERVDGVKWHLAGELLLASSGVELATANGVWVERERRAHYGGFQEWLAEQGSQEVDDSWGGDDINK